MNDLSRVQSIDRAVYVLKCFSERKKELRLSEISEQLGLNKSTVHGIVNTLKYHGLIDQDEKTLKYRLGLNLIGLGQLVIDSMDARGIGYPILEDICRELEETAHVCLLDGAEVVYVDKKECNESIKISTIIGSRSPAYFTADGKVLLASLDLEEQMNLIPETMEKFTPNTITSRKKLLKELSKIKTMGYAIDNEEYILGLICVAAPVYDYSGKVKYGVSVTGPSVRMTEEKISRAVEVLVKSTKKISYLLGYRE